MKRGNDRAFFARGNPVSNLPLSSLLEIILPSTYRNYVRGLCGNYDGITRNEYMKPDGTVVRDVNTFGNSWKITDRQPGGLRSFQVPHSVHRWDLKQDRCSDIYVFFYRFVVCNCLTKACVLASRREVETDPDSGFDVSDCSQSQLNDYSGTASCGALSDASGPFAACHEILSPQTYQE